ncbi:MAG: hypothetical protein Fur002_04940 [Anaerolineales bacterium]
MTAKHIPFGEPVNKSEEKVFNYLIKNLPDDYTVLTNLTVTQSGHDYDFDAVVLGKHAIYVLEIKDYRMIRGNASKWQVYGEDGSVYLAPRNPLAQAAMQASVLKGSLKNLNPKFGKIFVQDIVCLACEKTPQIDIQDNAERKKKIQWYLGIEKFITDPSQLMYPPEWQVRTKDISAFHADVIQAIQTGFSAPPALPKKIRGYEIKDRAWTSRRYRAYLASQEGHYPARSLIKVYKVPAMQNPADAQKYVEDLGRELAALRAVRDMGDVSSGGYKNVVVGYDAFPLYRDERQIREYMVVMEWVEGKNLLDIIKTRRLSLREKYQVAAQICRGILFAHSAGVVHRNLNLKNIIHDVNGVVKIVNFDFAKFIGGTPMSTFTIPGVLSEDTLKDYLDDFMKQLKYVAPEIRSGDGLPSFHQANKETDLYALGVILFELFSGATLEKNSPLDFSALRAASGLDDRAAKDIALLTSSAPADRALVALESFSKELTKLAQNLKKEEQLPLLPQGFLFGKYEIVSCLSRTEMSDVYQAKEADGARLVVIKFLRASSDDAVEELRAAYRSWKEIDARYTARWLGEGVAFALNGKIIDGVSDDVNAFRVHYLVTEYLEGINLRKFLEQGIPSPESALEIGSKIIAAVSAIHQMQWVHRDIKPANIILDNNGAARVVDFGLSQRIENPASVKGVSPGYTPPEIYEDGASSWTFQGDVYSTACVILSLFFGEDAPNGPAFKAANEQDQTQLRKLIGDELANILLRDLERNPLQRHSSAAEMQLDWQSAMTRRTAPMAEIDYNRILKKIETLIQERDDELDYGGAAAYRSKANQLTAWVNGGKQGECPVDLSEFGVDVISASAPKTTVPQQPAKEKEPAPSEATPEPAPRAGEEVAALTPEERNIQEKLKEIREHIDMGRLRQAVALAVSVESHSTGDSKNRAAQLLDEARQKREHAVALANKKGDEVLKKGDKEQARQHYEVALDLDPDNERAKTALRQMETDAASGKLSPQKVTELRGGLRDLKNIKRLGAAVYEAEALDAEGKLTKELQTLLRESREKYNQIRTAQGDETTMMRFGDLAARKEARDRIASRLAKGEQYVYDVTSNEDKPAFDMLREADKLLEQQSADTAQYEFDVVNGLLPAHPGGAKARLENALARPFYDFDRKKLERKLEEVNQLIEQQKGAEAFIASAAEQDDPVRAFGVILKAQSAFPYLPGLEVELAQARAKALAYLIRKMEDAFAQARGWLGGAQSAEARSLINSAMHLVDGWPQPEKPEQLQTLLEQGKLLLVFDTQALQIRQEAEDPNRVGAALKKLEEMRKDERFAPLPEMRLFVSDMDQYRDTGDQLREAREARLQGDWRRVFDLTTKIRESKNSGALAGQVEALYLEAEQEVRIEDARSLLDNLEIKKANSILSQIIVTEKDPTRQAALKERLKAEQQIIAAAIENTPLMQPAYDRAVALRNGREEERLEALRIFRYLGGIVKEKPSAELPDYIFTLRTDDARKAAVDVGVALRERCLQPIEKAFKSDKRKKVEPDVLERLAQFARVLREGGLTYSADEHAAVRWAEVEWGKHLAHTKESVQDWSSAAEIWTRLHENYPGDEDVAKSLDEARKQQENIQRILGIADSAKPRDALLSIKDALENADLKQFAPLLKERRDKIFQTAQEDLLKLARDVLTTGSTKGKIDAFVALVDLRELEEIVGVPESRRRSVAELKTMNPNDFKNAVEVVLQQSNTFSPSQGTVKTSIEVTKELVSRLQMFMKIAPLFPGRLSDLEERLERRRSELAFQNQRLEEVHRLLVEVWQPDLWADAVSRGSFDVLRMKRDAMAVQGLPAFTTIPDIKEFDLKMREVQEAYEHIKTQATEMKQAFDLREDFKKVADISRRLTSRPIDWQVVSPQAYEQILADMDYLFRVTNVYGSGAAPAGRAEIAAAAQERERQFEIWLAWEKIWRQKMFEAEQAGQVVKKYQTLADAPTAVQLRDWTAFLEKAQSAVEVLKNSPGAKESIASKKTLDIFEASRQAASAAEDWVYSAKAAIELLDKEPKFPSAEEFSGAAARNDLRGLQQLITRADRAGAITEEETKRLNTYKATYKRMYEEAQRLANKKWWDLR